MLKKITALSAVLLILLSFAGCSKKADHSLTVDSVNIPTGVYNYYLDKVLSYPKEYSVDTDDRESVLNKASELCSLYVAAQKLMEDEKLTLSQQAKAEISQQTESLWSLFSEYYKSIGVGKPDITNVMTNEARKKQLVEYYYGEGGKKPVSESDLKQKFVEMYIGFKAFEGTFTKVNSKGETVEMSDSEKAKLEKEFREMANRVDSGTPIDTVYSEYCEKQGLIATSALEMRIAKNKDPMYDDDFFSKMSTITHGRAAIVKSGSSVYVVQRLTIASADDDAFIQYRSQVLYEMKMPAVEKKLASLAQKYEIESNDRKINEALNLIKK